MLFELDTGEYKKVLSLFSDEPLTYFPIVVKAIVDGNTPGRLWVDDPTAPATMLMWDEGPILGLAGSANNPALNEELATLVSKEVGPAALAKSSYGFKMFYTDGWEEAAGQLFKDAPLLKRGRAIYSFDKLKVENWRDKIPDGGSIRQIDMGLLGSEDLENLDRVTEEIACCWTSVEHFLGKGFGFCLVTGDKIASWCTAEYASGTDRGIGIETVEECQGRGFATLTACAFVEHCMANGLTPYWDAWQSNIASTAVAEKVGFKRARDYSVLLGSFATS